MTYDLGDVVALGITLTDSSGAVANASSVACTVYLPDGTTASATVTNPSTGLYNANYVPSQVGRHAVKWVATGTNASAYSDEFTVRDFADLGIVSLADVKAHINYNSTSTADDEELRRVIDAATDLCEQYVGQVLGRRTFTNELYDGNTEHLRLRNPRAISITSVYENGVLLPAAAYALDPTGQRLFRVGSGTLYATNSYGFWTGGMQNISVTYVAGFVNPPASAKQGVLEVIRHLWQTQRGSMNVGGGRGLQGDETYVTPSYSLPRRAMELLDPLSFPGVA